MKIERKTLYEDILVFCKSASSFPLGVKAAHEFIHDHFPLNPKYQYFGLSKMENDELWYKVGISGIQPKLAEELQLEKMILKSGNYALIHINGFMEDVSLIGKAFDKLLGNIDYDPSTFALEWYCGIDQVDCLVKMKSHD